MALHDPYVPFYFTYQHISPRADHPTPPPLYRKTSFRMPPVDKAAFRSFGAGPRSYYAWSPGIVQLISAVNNTAIKWYRTSSVFWCPRHATYMTVPYDCTQESVREKAEEDELDNWEILRFGYEKIGSCSVSVVGHRYPEDVLVAPGQPTWMPELIPKTHRRYEPRAHPETIGDSVLAGDLSIILGLAALSTPRDTVVQTIQHSFRPRHDSFNWEPHGRSDLAREEERGVVMQIYYNPLETSKEKLKAWESGENVPILI